MATQIDLEQEQADDAPRKLTLIDILAGGNLAEQLPESDLTAIGQKVIRDVELDEASRAEWMKGYERSLDVAMQVRKAKNFPWPNAANVKYPLLTVAAIQFQARAYPVIVDGSNLVKGRVLGPDPDGKKRERAERIGQHMTWQLLYRMPDWEEETDKLLLMLPIVGCVFRKTYYDEIEQSNVSEVVPANDFIIDYWAKSIKRAPRFTHVLRFYPHEIEEKVAAGIWREVDYENRDGGADDDAIIELYEQHRNLDLDEDGFAEPYVVTCTKDGDVARIVPCFGADDVSVTIEGRIAKLADVPLEMVERVERVVRIDRRQYFSKYGFIPAPDGSFYDLGFGSLLDGLGQTIDTLQNQMLDAATLANAGGGFLGTGVNIRGGSMPFRIGEWRRVDTGNGSLRDNIMPLPAPGPSPVSFNLLEMLIAAAKEITAVQDVLTGQSTPNQPATTTLALIEQGQKVMTGIFKRIHRSFGQDCRMLMRLNRDYLDDEEYFQLNDADQAVNIGRADYEDRDLDVISVSDPTQISDIQRLTKAQALMQSFNGDPLINQRLLRQQFLEAVGVRDTKAYFDVPPHMPDPKAELEKGKLLIAKQDADSRSATAQAAATQNFASAAEKLAGLGLLPDAATLAAAAVEESYEEEMNNDAGEASGAAAGPGAVPGMEGPPGDAGIPPLPTGPADGLGDGMGGGASLLGGGAGASPDFGAAGEPQP